MKIGFQQIKDAFGAYIQVVEEETMDRKKLDSNIRFQIMNLNKQKTFKDKKMKSCINEFLDRVDKYCQTLIGRCSSFVYARVGQGEVVVNLKVISFYLNSLEKSSRSLDDPESELLMQKLELCMQANLPIQDIVDIECKNRSGRTLLHLAALEGKLDVVDFLLKNGANLSERDDNDLSPIHLAALQNHIPVIHRLQQEAEAIEAKNLVQKTSGSGNRDEGTGGVLSRIASIFFGDS